MATVTGLTATRMLAIEAASVVNGVVVGDNLLLTKYDGTQINAGSVRGPQGSPGVAPLLYSSSSAAITSLVNGSITIVTGFAFVSAASSSGASSLVTIVSNGNHTVNQAGLYSIKFSASFANSTVGRRIVFIYVNGAEVRRHDVGSGGLATVQVCHDVPLVVGDILTFRCYQNSGGALALAASPGHDANIMKLS